MTASISIAPALVKATSGTRRAFRQRSSQRVKFVPFLWRSWRLPPKIENFSGKNLKWCGRKSLTAVPETLRDGRRSEGRWSDWLVPSCPRSARDQAERAEIPNGAVAISLRRSRSRCRLVDGRSGEGPTALTEHVGGPQAAAVSLPGRDRPATGGRPQCPVSKSRT